MMLLNVVHWKHFLVVSVTIRRRSTVILSCRNSKLSSSSYSIRSYYKQFEKLIDQTSWRGDSKEKRYAVCELLGIYIWLWLRFVVLNQSLLLMKKICKHNTLQIYVEHVLSLFFFHAGMSFSNNNCSYWSKNSGWELNFFLQKNEIFISVKYCSA